MPNFYIGVILKTPPARALVEVKREETVELNIFAAKSCIDIYILRCLKFPASDF